MDLIGRITLKTTSAAADLVSAAYAFELSMCWDVGGRDTPGTILENFPDLEAEDIPACLAYAVRELDHPILVTAV